MKNKINESKRIRNEFKRIEYKRIILPKLSYQVMGVLFKVQNKLGSSYQEKYYQRAIQQEFKIQKIPFEREKQITLTYEGSNIGKYYLDFVIDEKIILEIKATPFIRKDWIEQVVAYLVSTGLPLGIIVNFRTDKIEYKRIINPNLKDKNISSD